MSNHQHILESQISLIEKAMQDAGIWSRTIPSWVLTYQSDSIPDIWQWMQYIYLPMRKKGLSSSELYLAPIIEPYIRATNVPIEILHRIIELDALTPVFPNSTTLPK